MVQNNSHSVAATIIVPGPRTKYQQLQATEQFPQNPISDVKEKMFLKVCTIKILAVATLYRYTIRNVKDV